VEFVVCESPEQVRQAQRLRYEVYCLEKSWVEAHECDDGIEADASDPLATHFLAIDDGIVVGTVRLLLGWREVLPGAKYLDLASLGLEPSQTVEVSRLATKRIGRSQDLRIFLGLTKLMWSWATEHSALAWLAIADVPLYHMLTRLGLPVLLESEPVDYLGSECIPIAFDMPGTGPVLNGARR
jgi:N-acyl-L-homoserine lactone synthetase